MFCNIFSKLKKSDRLFENIVGYENEKRLFRMALESEHTPSILLSGPPASAKTMFLESLMKLPATYFVDGGNSSKAGMLEYLFNHKPRRVLIDELDKLSTKDQTSLLNLIETGIISETKYKKTRSMKIKTAVFATSNNLERIIAPLQSRFFIVKLEPYSYEQFYKITVNLLTRQSSMEIKMAEAIAKTVWSTSKNIRDCVRIGKMADSFDDVNWIVGTFL